MLVAAHSGCQGGAELCLDVLLSGTDPAVYELDVRFACDGPMVDRCRRSGWSAAVEPWAWWLGYEPSGWYRRNLWGKGWLRVLRYAALIRRGDFDLVYTNSAVIFEPALAARLAGVPHIWHVHEILDPAFWPTRLTSFPSAARRLSRWSRRLIFESHAARRVCEAYIESAKTRVIHNPLRFGADDAACPRVREQAAALRSRLGLTPEDVMVLWLGRFSPRKDPLLLVRAAARLADRSDLPNVVPVFLGEGPLLSQVADALGNHGRICEFQADVRPWLAACDVLTLTSRQESFGLVLLEAAAFGKPVIATRAEGPAEVVREGETGLLIPPGDDAALAEALALLADRRDVRQRMGQAAQRWAFEHFSADRYVQAVHAVWAECWEACPSNPGAS
ncbi:MAG: glycosyltransferase family 4 protein [Thermogutta sp.]